jgi:hypothetical protein
MKRNVLLMLLLVVVWEVNIAYAQETIPDVVLMVLDDLNEYLITPMALTDEGVEWEWSVVTLDDLGQNCRERSDTETALPTIAYDIVFYRHAEQYHYRVTTDEQLILRCLPMANVPANTPSQVVDALADLSRLLHLTLTPNDLPWRWREVQFDDYTLDCPESAPLEETFDQKINGYQIEFIILGQQWDYRVSADRLIVILCESEEPSDSE